MIDSHKRGFRVIHPIEYPVLPVEHSTVCMLEMSPAAALSEFEQDCPILAALSWKRTNMHALLELALCEEIDS